MIIALGAVGFLVVLFVVLPTIGWIIVGFVEGCDWGWPNENPWRDFYMNLGYGTLLVLIIAIAIAIGVMIADVDYVTRLTDYVGYATL